MRVSRKSWWRFSLLVGLCLLSAGRPAEGGSKTNTSTTTPTSNPTTHNASKPTKPPTPTTPQKPGPPTQPPAQPKQPPTPPPPQQPVPPLPTTPPRSAQSAQQLATPQPSYAKGQLIVKYKDSVTECVHCLLKSKRAAQLATSDHSDSLDRLHVKYQVRAARPLFRSEAEEARLSDTGLASLQSYHRSRLRGAQSTFAKRSRRTTAQAQLPDLSHVYLLELAPDTDVAAAAVEFAKDPHVAYAQPNYLANRLVHPERSLLQLQRLLAPNLR